MTQDENIKMFCLMSWGWFDHKQPTPAELDEFIKRMKSAFPEEFENIDEELLFYELASIHVPEAVEVMK